VQQRGLFALTWQAHGLHYGIGREIQHWLERGAKVLVNGSRDAYPQARERFPSLQPVVITASRETIAGVWRRAVVRAMRILPNGWRAAMPIRRHLVPW
jgi:phosphonate metabolism protein PhnN/1,5-bisphosphokinase (PRPP-forming)